MQFAVDPKSALPIWYQIVEQIKHKIASGQLRPEQQLPTVRQLAVDLTVNANTVAKAYSELEREGILTTRQGRGTFVSAKQNRLSPDVRRQYLLEQCGKFLANLTRYDYRQKEILKALKKTFNEFRIKGKR